MKLAKLNFEASPDVMPAKSSLSLDISPRTATQAVASSPPLVGEGVSAIAALDVHMGLVALLGSIAPVCVAGGASFAVALSKLRQIDESLTLWVWGIDAVAFVVAGLCIVCTALLVGVKFVFFVGVLGYLMSALSAHMLD